MKLFKSALLAAPAILMGVAAHAADLPSFKSAPIEYVRVCDAYGAGFFYIPGTNTCLRVGGYVRAEYNYTPGRSINVINSATGAVSQIGRAQDTTGMEVRGRIDVDSRTQTAWGTVQTVVELRGTTTDGEKALSGSTATTSAIAAGGVYTPPGNGATSLTIERAYIRFAGVTAGDAEENFSAIAPYMWVNYPYPSYPNGVKQLAYTYTFGSGFSSTLAIESAGDTYYQNGVSQYTYNNTFDTGYNLIGNTRYDSTWGFVQVAGALADNSARTNLSSVPNSVTLVNAPSYSPTTAPSTYGAFALESTISVKLPMIAAGDQLQVQGAYGHGLLGLIGCTSASDCSDASERRLVGGVLRQDQNMVPVSASGAAGAPGYISYGTTDAWAVSGIFTHYFAPDWRTNLAVGYEQFLPPSAGSSVGVQLGDAELFMVGGQLIWSPVKNFDIGIEIDYEHLNSNLQNAGAANVGAGSNNVSAAWLAAGSPGLSSDNWTGRIRLQRQF
jgi:Porin subfamily